MSEEIPDHDLRQSLSTEQRCAPVTLIVGTLFAKHGIFNELGNVAMHELPTPRR